MMIIRITLIFSLTLLLTSCVKYDDPELGPFSAPCSSTLEDNRMSSTITASSSQGQIHFQDPTYIGNVIYGNSATFTIQFGSPITSDGIYNLTSSFLSSENEAKITYTVQGLTSSTTYVSTQGSLYIDYVSDDNIKAEWCEIECQSISGSSNTRLSSGRVVVN